MILRLVDKYAGYGSCSTKYPKSHCITYVKDRDHLPVRWDKDVVLFIPMEMTSYLYKDTCYPEMFQLESVPNVEYTFTMLHNFLNFRTPRRPDLISSKAIIDPTAIIGLEGEHVVRSPVDGTLVQMKHMGNVVIESGVQVFPLANISCAVFDSTIIGEGTVIGPHVHIGHNAEIGKNCVITAGSVICGSVIGNRCLIGVSSMVRPGITICDDVVLGAGTVVVKDILEPGTYVGSPARLLEPYSPDQWL